MDYNTFVTKLKQRGIYVLLKETTVYPGGITYPNYYAELHSTLVGYYSNNAGGVIFKKPPRNWSKRDRTFEKVLI